MGHFPTFSLKWSLLNIHLYFLCDEQGGQLSFGSSGDYEGLNLRKLFGLGDEASPHVPAWTTTLSSGNFLLQRGHPTYVGGHPHWKLFLVDRLSKRALPILKPAGRDKVLNTYSWPFPKFNALLKIINTWWNGHHHFTQPRFPQTVTPKIINWKTMRINHSNISFMGGIYYEKWKTSVEFSNNWLLAEFVLSAARVAPEGVGRAVAVEESKKSSWVLWARSPFG